jgi:hypothetical protein
MKLKKDEAIRIISDAETIKIFQENGWEEVKPEKPSRNKKTEEE